MERDQLIRGALDKKLWAVGLTNGLVFYFKWSDPDPQMDNGVILYEADVVNGKFSDHLDRAHIDAFHVAWYGKHSGEV